MIVKLLTEHHWCFKLKRRLQRLVRVYTCQIVGNLMPGLISFHLRMHYMGTQGGSWMKKIKYEVSCYLR